MRQLKDPNRLRRLLVPTLCLILMFCASNVRAEQSATEVIKAFNATLLECMKKAKELGYPGRYKLIDPVFKNSFAISYMGSTSAGKYWKTLNERQKASLLEAYTEWSVATYAGRFDDYSGEKFETAPESKPVQGIVTVISKIIDRDGEETVFHYKLRKMDGKWKIVDIQISGVSQLAITRAQFVSVLGDKGFDGLIRMLKEKTANFARFRAK